MAIKSYQTSEGKRYKIDTWLNFRGKKKRFRLKDLPTKGVAEKILLEAQIKAKSNVWLADEVKTEIVTVAYAWSLYEPYSAERNKSHRDHVQRSKVVLGYFGERDVLTLTEQDVVMYRAQRKSQRNQHGKPLAPATIDREVALLKRIVSYAAKVLNLGKNPLAKIEMLNVPNVRGRALYEHEVATIVSHVRLKILRTIIWVAYDTGMRSGELRHLQWDRIDLQARVISLLPEDTKTKKGRVIPMTDRVHQLLSELVPNGKYVFVSARTNKPYTSFKRGFATACRKADIFGVTFHDLRRSFVTMTRKAGVAESTIMKISGHKTMSVFARYNIIDDTDLFAAVQARTAKFGHDLDTHPQINQKRGDLAATSPKVNTAKSLKNSRRARHDLNVRPTDSKSGFRFF